MTHLWLRAETKPNEARTPLMPEGAARLVRAGMTVTVEESPARVVPVTDFAAAGARIAPAGSWPTAPADALILGLKELPDDGTPLVHDHVFFGHAYKGQPDGLRLLERFRDGGGRLLDLEYLTDETGRRVAAFGYWAGFAGAGVALDCWAAQRRGGIAGPVAAQASSAHLIARLQSDLVALGAERPTALIIGAKGRVGTGAADLCREMGVATTLWDIDETASGGPFPEVLTHDLFLNCILARPGTPVFVPAAARVAPRRLSVIGDIACDPTSDFSPIKVYDRTTDWQAPALRVHESPPLDVTAIDNLPSLLPLESSQDFAGQLLPTLSDLPDSPVWERARAIFAQAIARL